MGSARHLVLLILLSGLFSSQILRSLAKEATPELASIDGRCVVMAHPGKTVPRAVCLTPAEWDDSLVRTAAQGRAAQGCSVGRRHSIEGGEARDLYFQVRRGDGTCRAERRNLPPRLAFALGRPIDLGRASLDELLLLPGIGPARARAIIRYREENEGIESLEHLDAVRGIGAGILSRLRGMAVGSAR